MSSAERDVLNERRRQIKEEGFTHRGDDQYDPGTLASAATCYGMYAADMLHPLSQGDGYAALEGAPPLNWPWRAEWWKPKTSRDAMVKAAALLIAEIEKFDRSNPGTARNDDGVATYVEVSKSTNGKDVIPEMTDPLGAYWEQPDRQMIFIRDGKALLDPQDFKKLSSYDTSLPSGVYPGKMWKRTNAGVSYLCWFGEDKGGHCSINHLPIEVAQQSMAA
jgi:hypothetical protein